MKGIRLSLTAWNALKEAIPKIDAQIKEMEEREQVRRMLEGVDVGMEGEEEGWFEDVRETELLDQAVL